MRECCRCHEPLEAFTMSRFNTDEICIPCLEREQKHPKYQEAYDAELKACQNGNYNFLGIGCPPDLYL